MNLESDEVRKKLRTDKEFQAYVAELKKKNTGEITEEKEFEELPEENENTVSNE